jgi:hypothetical protein
MKPKIYLLMVTAFIFTITAQSQTKKPQLSPTAKIEQNIGFTDIQLEYSRPSKRGRIIFGDLVPYGKKWRTGANSNTKITFSTDVTIGEKTLKKGTYAIYSIPNKNQWEIIFYKDSDNWGLPKKWDESKVALKVPARVRTLCEYIETFTIGFDYFNDPYEFILSFTWDTTSAVLKIKLPKE